ncbi:MAG TPA: hypothetical protein DDY18_10750, partial [Flavobacterium sp.]|nr:hypothetical protein [Flavobacterium sp.]
LNTKQKPPRSEQHDITASIDAFDKLVLDKKGTNATKDDLLLSELQLSIGKQSINDVYKRVEEVYSDERIIKIGNNIATKNLLTREEFLIDFAKSKTTSNPVKEKLAFEKACEIAKEASGFDLNEEQKRAVRQILFSESNVVAIQGKAGTGKSSLLLAATLALQLDGRKVYGTATAGKAAAGLLEAGMNGIDNSAALLQKLKNQQIKLQRGDVIVIDEAGMMNTAQFYAIAKYAEKAKAKIVSLGDYEQLQAIGAGGIHKLICDTCGYVELKEVFRQKDKEDAVAGLQISAGNAIEAINHFKNTNCYKVCDTKSAMLKEIASNLTSSTTPYENKFAVTDTRELGRVLSNEIQKIRLENKEVNNAVSIEIQDPNEPLSQLSQKFAVGDRIAFLQGAKNANPIFNDANKLANVQNGHFGTITKIEKANDDYKITVKHDKLGEVSFNTNEYKTFALGYAGTLHKSQGATLKECHWGTENPDKHKGYVAATRHTEKNSFFLYTTKDAEADLAKKMSTASYNKSVKELLDEISRKKTNYTPIEPKNIYYKPSQARYFNEVKTVNQADTLLNAKSLLQAESLLDKLQKPTPTPLKPFIEKPTKTQTPVIPLMTNEDWDDRFLINRQIQKTNDDKTKIELLIKNEFIDEALRESVRQNDFPSIVQCVDLGANALSKDRENKNAFDYIKQGALRVKQYLEEKFLPKTAINCAESKTKTSKEDKQKPIKH